MTPKETQRMEKAELKAVRKSWGPYKWSRIRSAAKRKSSNGRAPIVMGRWSSNGGLYHAGLAYDLLRYKEAPQTVEEIVLECVTFTDGTRLNVSVEWLTPDQILQQRIWHGNSYEALLRKAAKLCKPYVSVDEEGME